MTAIAAPIETFTTAVPAAAMAAAAEPVRRLTADELVEEAIRCIITGRDLPESLRAPSAISPGIESVQARIAEILAGPRYV
jgi:hypothetical protein